MSLEYWNWSLKSILQLYNFVFSIQTNTIFFLDRGQNYAVLSNPFFSNRSFLLLPWSLNCFTREKCVWHLSQSMQQFFSLYSNLGPAEEFESSLGKEINFPLKIVYPNNWFLCNTQWLLFETLVQKGTSVSMLKVDSNIIFFFWFFTRWYQKIKYGQKRIRTKPNLPHMFRRVWNCTETILSLTRIRGGKIPSVGNEGFGSVHRWFPILG